ncbi:hypothetical protein Tco_1559037, partial [Tanacetum coccineum]
TQNPLKIKTLHVDVIWEDQWMKLPYLSRTESLYGKVLHDYRLPYMPDVSVVQVNTIVVHQPPPTTDGVGSGVKETPQMDDQRSDNVDD